MQLKVTDNIYNVDELTYHLLVNNNSTSQTRTAKMRRAFTNCQLLKIRTNVLDHGLFLKVLFVFSALNLVFKWLSTQDILMATRFRIAQPSTQRCYTDIEDLTSPIIPASQLLYDIVLLDQCCTNVCTTPCNYTGTRSAI